MSEKAQILMTMTAFTSYVQDGRLFARIDSTGYVFEIGIPEGYEIRLAEQKPGQLTNKEQGDE